MDANAMKMIAAGVKAVEEFMDYWHNKYGPGVGMPHGELAAAVLRAAVPGLFTEPPRAAIVSFDVAAGCAATMAEFGTGLARHNANTLLAELGGPIVPLVASREQVKAILDGWLRDKTAS